MGRAIETLMLRALIRFARRLAKFDAVTAAKLSPQPKARAPARGDKPTRR
jgi:hypothetical protein